MKRQRKHRNFDPLIFRLAPFYRKVAEAVHNAQYPDIPWDKLSAAEINANALEAEKIISGLRAMNIHLEQMNEKYVEEIRRIKKGIADGFPAPVPEPRVDRVLVVRKPVPPKRTIWDRLFRRPVRQIEDRRRKHLFNNGGNLFVPEELLEYVDPVPASAAENAQYAVWREQIMNRHAFDRHR